MDYQKTLPQITNNIKPISGNFFHNFNLGYNNGLANSLGVEFILQPFDYVDPFYGNINSKSNFNMFFETSPHEEKITIKNPYEIQNMSYDFQNDPIRGGFSNSLDFNVTKCQFGNIEKLMIDFVMEFYLTNSNIVYF